MTTEEEAEWVVGMHPELHRVEPYRRASSGRILAGRIRIIAASVVLCGIGAALLGLWVVSFAERNAAVLLPAG
jgi:hypothetical protein